MINQPEDFAFRDNNEFSLFIETEAHQKQMSVVDVILEFCEQHMLEPSDIVPYINRSLKEKLEMAFVESKLLPKTVKLEF